MFILKSEDIAEISPRIIILNIDDIPIKKNKKNSFSLLFIK